LQLPRFIDFPANKTFTETGHRATRYHIIFYPLYSNIGATSEEVRLEMNPEDEKKIFCEGKSDFIKNSRHFAQVSFR